MAILKNTKNDSAKPSNTRKGDNVKMVKKDECEICKRQAIFPKIYWSKTKCSAYHIDIVTGKCSEFMKIECENCNKLQAKIDALEIKVEELEEAIPEESFDETRRIMQEDFD